MGRPNQWALVMRIQSRTFPYRKALRPWYKAVASLSRSGNFPSPKNQETGSQVAKSFKSTGRSYHPQPQLPSQHKPRRPTGPSVTSSREITLVTIPPLQPASSSSVSMSGGRLKKPGELMGLTSGSFPSFRCLRGLGPSPPSLQ